MSSKYPKILIISAWYPNSLHEAEGDFIRHQARLLQDSGLEVEVFHASLSIRHLLKGRFTRREISIDHGLKEHLVESPFWPRNNSWGIKAWAEKFSCETIKHMERGGRPEIIHAHTYLGGFVAHLIKTQTGIPYMLTLHESYILSGAIPSYHKPLLRTALQSADHVTTVGKALSNEIKKYGEVSPVALPNFIDFELFKIRKKKSGRFRFIYVGELISRKRVDLLIESFDKVFKTDNKIELVILGAGPLETPLKNKANKLRSFQHIHFKARMNQKDVAIQIAESDCLVLPSESETFGIVLAEAMACGVPFISTRSGVTEEWFKHPACNFIGYSSDELIESMILSIHNKKLLDPADIREHAQMMFSVHAVIKEYKQTYLSLTQ